MRIAVVYPDLLGTYGDGGNGLILARRAQWRGDRGGSPAGDLRTSPLPEADIYCLGGGEDGPQVRAARSLIEDGVLRRRAAEGAVVLAVCAGYQIVGKSFPGADGVAPRRGRPSRYRDRQGHRHPRRGRSRGGGDRSLPAELDRLREPRRRDDIGPGDPPVGAGQRGIGNGDGTGTEGAVAGHVLGTYLHGPVLARNPALADLLLALGRSTPKSWRRSMTPPRTPCARNASALREDHAGPHAGCDVEAPRSAVRPHDGITA